MAINWNLAGYVSPNIEIAPEQLPLEALVKTSDVLQDRYDKSYENYTKAQEYQRQMLSQANEADKEAAQQIFSQYENQLKDVADRGDYHNMRWETLNLAQEAANNYASINEKNKAIQAQREAIAKDPRWQTSREQRIKDFELGLKSIQWDPTKRTITNLNVDPYTAAPDVNIMEKSIKYGSVMKPEDIGWKNGYLQYVDVDGKPVSNPMEAAFVNHIVNGKTTETLSADVIKKAVTNALLQDEDVKAVKQRDLGYLAKTGEIKFTGDPVKDKAIEDAYDLEHIMKPAGAAGDLLKVHNVMTTSDVSQNQGALFAGSGNSDINGGMYEPTSVNVSPETKEQYNNELHNAWNASLQGSSQARMSIRANIQGAIADAKAEGDTKKVNSLTSKLDDLQFLWKMGEKNPEILQDLQATSALDPTGSRLLKTKARTNKYANLTPEELKRLSTITPNVTQTKLLERSSWFDTELSKAYENQKSPRFLNVQMQRPDLMNTEIQNKLTTAGKNLKWSDFNISKDEWKDKDNNEIRIIGYATEPIPGEGMMLELMDSKNNTYYATPRKTTGRSILNNISRHLYRPFEELNFYKDVMPPSSRTKAVSLLREGNVPYKSKNANTPNKALFNFSNEAEIQPNSDGSYTLIDGNKSATYPSIYTLLYQNSINRQNEK